MHDRSLNDPDYLIRSAGEQLRAEIQRLGIDQIGLAEAIGVSRQTINNIVAGRQKISREIAPKLAKITGRDSDYWLHDAYPVPPEEPKPSVIKRRSRKLPLASFEAFIREQRGEVGRGFAETLQKYPSLPEIHSWRELQTHLRNIGASRNNLRDARALWWMYLHNKPVKVER